VDEHEDKSAHRSRNLSTIVCITYIRTNFSTHYALYFTYYVKSVEREMEIEMKNFDWFTPLSIMRYAKSVFRP